MWAKIQKKFLSFLNAYGATTKKANIFYSECKIVQIESCAAPINFKVDKVEKPQVVVIGYSIFPKFYYFSL